MKIKDILTIDLSEDIKNVIDLEDISEQEIQSEIESYIVTDGLASEYSDFVTTFTSNILETGVWISGFYGSGKSYFGKLLGYMISNRPINGTNARDRIMQRFIGINDEAFIKNVLSRLDAVRSRVVFLDIAKQDTSKGFSFTLFRNFLKSLELPENEHGYFLFQLMFNEANFNIHSFIETNLNKNWSEIKTRLVEYARASKEIYLNQGNTQSDYENLMTTLRREIDQFSPAKLKDELTNYLQVVKNEKIVLLFDEASEAINQKKFTLLDLEGVSEALSSLGGKVWTIAIAQEKLDDVINNANVTKVQLTKVTDRFKTKIHLEATEVDVIIRNRLLKKSDEGSQVLSAHYKKNAGKIADHAAIHGAGITKTDSESNYMTYYPFYKYQFDLLQNFLFGTKGYASTKVAARGMIITTYDVIKKEVQHHDIFNTVTGWQVARAGQPQPPVRLVSRYDNAERILSQSCPAISGRKLLETINFLTEAETTPSTLPNIVKSYISNPDDYHKVQDDIIKALEMLTEAKVLLDTNKTYRITSDIEQRLLDEMNGFTVQGFIKKKQLVAAYKTANFTKTIGRITDNGVQFDFFITTENEDELTTPSLKYLKVKIKSMYSISDDRAADIELLKVQHQNDKDLIWLVPDNTNFRDMDRLIDEVERITYLEQKYNNPNSEEGKILMSFSTAKGEKQNKIKELVEASLANATSIYLYNTSQLDKDIWSTTMLTNQKQVIQNVYHKRLASQLGENVALMVIKEHNNARLHQYFTGNDFAFFDTNGNFVGDNLKVTEEILYKIRNTFIDGATLEKDLEHPPAGYAYGTVVSTIAALMRAGKVIAKYNGAEKFSWKDEGVTSIFAAAREFRKSTFKAISKSLSTVQKQELAQFLLDIEVEKYIGRRIDYNTNDFELVNAIRDTANYFRDKVQHLRNGEKDFDKLFPSAENSKEVLSMSSGAISEANYIDKAVEFLGNKDSFHNAILDINKIDKFIQNNLPKAKQWRQFTIAVDDELIKAAKPNSIIQNVKTTIDGLYSSGVVSKFAEIQQAVQKIKDEYHSVFSLAMRDCSEKYKEILQASESLIAEINALPPGLNETALSRAHNLLQYAKQRTKSNVDIDFDVKDKLSRFTYSEVLSYDELYPTKKAEIEFIRAGLIKSKTPDPAPPGPGPAPAPTKKTFKVTIPKSNISVSEYKSWLHGELQKLASASDNDEIEID